jgi:RimJ/RimL family protein N-acetyltransferase
MSATNLGPPYRIVTPRLVLRCWSPTDAPLLKRAIDSSIDHLLPWIPWAHLHPQPIEEVIATLRRFRGEFDLGLNFHVAILDRAERDILGGTGTMLRVGPGAQEIGYWLAARHGGKGIATEAVAALVKAVFTFLDVQRLEIHCQPENEPSARVAQKLGFVHEATRRRLIQTASGSIHDRMIWTLFKDEWPGSAASTLEIEAFDAAGRKMD